jgi:hypothetical protein
MLRFLLRMGPELPEGAAVDAGLKGVYYLGLWAMNGAGLLAIVVAGLLIAALSSRRRQPFPVIGMVSASAVVLVIGAWAASKLGAGNGTALLAAQVIGVALASVIATSAAPWKGWRRLWLAAAAATYVAGAAHYIARLAAADAVTSSTLMASEAFALGVALLAPWALNASWDRRAAFAAGGVAVMYLGFAVAHPEIAKYLVIWDTGFGSSAPAALHAVALLTLTYAAAALLLKRENILAATGLLLVGLGGLKLDYTYYSLIAVTGFILLVISPRPVGADLQRAGIARLALSRDSSGAAGSA